MMQIFTSYIYIYEIRSIYIYYVLLSAISTTHVLCVQRQDFVSAPPPRPVVVVDSSSVQPGPRACKEGCCVFTFTRYMSIILVLFTAQHTYVRTPCRLFSFYAHTHTYVLMMYPPSMDLFQFFYCSVICSCYDSMALFQFFYCSVYCSCYDSLFSLSGGYQYTFMQDFLFLLLYCCCYYYNQYQYFELLLQQSLSIYMHAQTTRTRNTHIHSL